MISLRCRMPHIHTCWVSISAMAAFHETAEFGA
jgi:hypothetical protein